MSNTVNLNFTCGTDIEMFLCKEEDNKVVSAVGIINGTKEKPVIMPNGASLHYDNVLAEFATPICNGKREWLNNCNTSFKLADGALPSGYYLSTTLASTFVPEEELQTEEAKQIGCSRDYNAYSLKANTPPSIEGLKLRSAGAHIHIGHLCLQNDMDKQIGIVRVMDALHGLISIELDDNDGSQRRKELYGKAGTYRPTAYGIEYRTLSNYWLKDERLQELMWLLSRDALQIVVNDEEDEFFRMLDDQGVNVQEDIDTAYSQFIIWMEEYRVYLGEDTVELLDELLYERGYIDQ
jgi:hypothetical protein